MQTQAEPKSYEVRKFITEKITLPYYGKSDNDNEVVGVFYNTNSQNLEEELMVVQLVENWQYATTLSFKYHNANFIQTVVEVYEQPISEEVFNQVRARLFETICLNF